MIKNLFLALLLWGGNLAAQSAEFQNLMNSLLSQSADYQQALNNYEQEKAFFKLEKSLGWFDLNLSYQEWDNNFTRKETRNVMEESDVQETDKRWRLELEKQLFPKDFDDASDAINARINLLRYEQELKLARFTCLADIFDDLILWFEADVMSDILQERLTILYDQNQILEELYLENLLDPETLILILEEIDDLEDNLYDFKEISSVMSSKYGDVLPEFRSLSQLYFTRQPQPDSLLFEDSMANVQDKLKKDIQSISGKIKWNYYFFCLPEISLSFSLNRRETRQKWDIDKNGALSEITRKQIEKFPEGEIEFSLPFNIFSNASSKLAILKSFERELQFRSRKLQLEWQEFAIKRKTCFQEARLELQRKSRLAELHQRDLQTQLSKMQEEPSSLGGNPKVRLQRKTLRIAEAELKKELAELKLMREIYLMQNLGD